MSYPTTGPLVVTEHTNRDTGERYAELRANFTVLGDLDVHGEITKSGNPLDSGGSAGAILRVTVELTNAQIKAVPTTLPVIVPAPGAAEVLAFKGAALVVDTSAAGYINVAERQIYFCYGDSGTVLASTAIDAELLLGQGVAATVFSVTEPANNSDYDLTMVENKELRLCVLSGAGDFAGGNAANSMKVTVFYAVIDT